MIHWAGLSQGLCAEDAGKESLELGFALESIWAHFKETAQGQDFPDFVAHGLWLCSNDIHSECYFF